MQKLLWPIKLLIVIGVFWPNIAVSPGLATRPDVTPMECAGSLELWGRYVPSQLKLSSCQVESGQLEVLVVRYTVKGADVTEVEKILRQKFRMGKLRFICCGWTTDYQKGFYRDKSGHYYEVTMSSPETIEQNLRRIPEFEVKVQKYLTEP
jgi:Domian of unknown function (DUF4952)